MMEDVCHDQRQKKEGEGGTGRPTSTLVQQRLCQHAEFRTTVAAHRHGSLCAGNIAGPGGFHLLVCGMSASDCLRRGETAFCTLSWIGGVWRVQLSSIDTFGFLQALQWEALTGGPGAGQRQERVLGLHPSNLSWQWVFPPKALAPSTWPLSCCLPGWVLVTPSLRSSRV